MLIAAFTDIHDRFENFEKIPEVLESADVLIFAGDITHFGHKKEMSTLFEKMIHSPKQIFAVTGNCDYPDSEDYLIEKNLSIHKSVITWRGYKICGLSGSLPCPGKTPNERSEEEFDAILKSLEEKTGLLREFIFITHQPPFGTINDEVSNGNHVGSQKIREFIERTQPLLCFTGHIHEGIGIDTIGKTKIINPGPFRNGNYAIANLVDNQIVELKIRSI